MDSNSPKFSRRTLFAGAAGLGLTGLAGGSASARTLDHHGSGDHGGTPLIAPGGDYEKVPLAKPFINIAAVQSRVRAVDLDNLRRTKRDNLNHLLGLIDAANSGWGGSRDLVFFHEFPITGYSHRWQREDSLRAAIDIPGPETEAVGAKAREYGCYIVFGSYVRDPDWPGHLLSQTIIIGPDGEIVDRHWKARNIKGVFGPGFELFTTTIYDVLDEYVERYGQDHVIPVTRTPIGNIATSSVQREPELFRAFAMKGAEIILRTATGGFTPLDIQATSLYNRVYTVIVNNAYSPDNPPYFADPGSGGSAIYGPDGQPVAEANSEHETAVTARIPIADFRARHTQPVVHMDLYRPVYDAYNNRFPPNLFSEYQPNNPSDAYQFLENRGDWSGDHRE